MKSRRDISKQEIEDIFNKCDSCVIGMIDEESRPYVLPFSFGYKDYRLFIHTGSHGKKNRIWQRDSRVCISFSTDYQITAQHEQVACSYSLKYRSILVHGNVQPITGLEEKVKALNIIMKKYSGLENFTYSKPALENVRVFEIVISKIESRVYGH